MPPKKIVNKDPLIDSKPKIKKEKKEKDKKEKDEKEDSDISDSDLGGGDSETEELDDQQDTAPYMYESDYEKTPEKQKPGGEALESDDDDESSTTLKKDQETKVKNIIPRLLAAPGAAGSDDEEEPMVIEYLGAEDDNTSDEITKKTEKRYKIVSPDKRQTSRRLSKPECARILGDRIRHIDNGAKIYLEDYSNCKSSEEIGYLELLSKKIPMGVIRHVGQNKVEIWKLSEMLLPKLPPLEVMLTRKN
jgi:hypothetical protein